MSRFWCINFEVAPTYLGNMCTPDLTQKILEPGYTPVFKQMADLQYNDNASPEDRNMVKS